MLMKFNWFGVFDFFAIRTTLQRAQKLREKIHLYLKPNKSSWFIELIQLDYLIASRISTANTPF